MWKTVKEILISLTDALISEGLELILLVMLVILVIVAIAVFRLFHYWFM